MQSLVLVPRLLYIVQQLLPIFPIRQQTIILFIDVEKNTGIFPKRFQAYWIDIYLAFNILAAFSNYV